MKQIVESISAFAQAIGTPGLFLIAFLDSSFLSFPQANDLLVIWMVLQNPSWMPLYAAVATLGSVTGCAVLHHLASRGGEAFLKKRFRAHRIERAMGLFERHGLLAILVPSLLPPPAPFKLFVLLAGVANVPRLRFIGAVAVGRGIRYFGQGLLAVWYGEEAIALLKTYGREVALGLAGAVVLGALGVFLWKRTRGQAAPTEI